MQINKFIIKNQGFTMVEMAMVLMILGLIMMGFLLSLSAWGRKYEVLKNEEMAHNIDQAITGFYAVTGRYPCPANPNLAQDNPQYGEEDCTLATVDGARDTDVDTDTQDDKIYYGMLPTVVYESADGTKTPEQRNTLKAYMPQYSLFGTETLGINQRPIIYAVTASMTRTTTFNADAGVIRVEDENQQSTGGSNNNVHYVAISNIDDVICPVSTIVLPPAGGGGGGAPVATGTQPPENENCDGDYIFVDALFNDSSSDNHFDDYVTYKVSDNSSVWGPIGNTTDIRNKNAGKVSIGPQYDPDAPASIKLDVDGNIKVTRLARTDLFCDNETQSCFNPKGVYSISCPKVGEYIKSTTLNGSTGEITVKCEPLEFINEPTCPAGKYLKGVYTNGEVDCVPK